MEEIKKQPVIVVLGHIDSGKTSLLMKIKDFGVLEKEAGGITQHIGAYEIDFEGQKLTFIDTPGHEAFSQMRSRGAKVADLAILVVDTTKGVQEQTKEAILHIKEANLPFIVALNKIDRIDSQPKKALRELEKEGVLVESLGGKVPAVEISAKTGQGIKDLLELIFITWEIEGGKANLEKKAEGVIIETFCDSKKGNLATGILEAGILKTGEVIGTKSALGKIKSLENFLGQKIERALPGQPVLILGFENLPVVGEKFFVFENLKEAENFLEKEKILPKKEFSLSEGQRILNIILKADCQGSLEALNSLFEKIPQEKVVLNVLKTGVGDFNENDLKLAKEKNAFLIGFRVKATLAAKILAERLKMKFFYFQVIYDVVETLRKLMEKILEPEIVREDLGKGKVLVIFMTEKRRQIIGCKILEGKVQKGCFLEIFRNEEKIGRGKVINLQKEKRDIKEAKKGEEVGILYEGDEKIKEEDEILFFKEERRKI